jgi:hypothetical protein
LESDKKSMTTTNTNDTGISAEVIVDAQLVAECVAAGRPIPVEVVRRIHDEAQKITAQLQQQYGTLDIGVPAIRELRGQLPQ